MGPKSGSASGGSDELECLASGAYADVAERAKGEQVAVAGDGDCGKSADRHLRPLTCGSIMWPLRR